MWGLPSSGKTSVLTALTKIKSPETITFHDDLVATKAFNMQDFYHTTDARYRIVLYDVGGASGNTITFFNRTSYHKLTSVNTLLGSDFVKKFCHDINAAIYAIDSSPKNKLFYPVVVEQLKTMCKVLPVSIPIILMLSKNDVAHFVSKEDILEGIKFEEIKQQFPSKEFHVISCSSVDHNGLLDILSWLADHASLS